MVWSLFLSHKLKRKKNKVTKQCDWCSEYFLIKEEKAASPQGSDSGHSQTMKEEQPLTGRGKGKEAVSRGLSMDTPTELGGQGLGHKRRTARETFQRAVHFSVLAPDP